MRALCGGALCAALVSLASIAGAIEIRGTFVGPGEPFTLVTGPAVPTVGGAPPLIVVGGGDFEAVFEAAADSWELAIDDDAVIEVEFGWADVPGISVGSAFFPSSPTSPSPPTGAVIIIDNMGTFSSFFADATPYDSKEYAVFTPSAADFGGGLLNTGRVYSSPLPGSPPAMSVVDLSTLFLHELGHVVGVNGAGSAIAPPFSPITAPLPMAGSALPVAPDGVHLALPSVVMGGVDGLGERGTLTAADVLAAAQHSEFVAVDLTPMSKTAVTGIGVGGTAGDWTLAAPDPMFTGVFDVSRLGLRGGVGCFGPSDVRLGVGGISTVEGEALIVLEVLLGNGLAGDVTEVAFELGVGLGDDFTPSTDSDGLEFGVAPQPVEISGAFVDFSDEGDDEKDVLTFSGSLAVSALGEFHLPIKVPAGFDSMSPMASRFTLRVTPVGPGPGDFDGDLDVDGDDLKIWTGAFGMTDAGDADCDGDSDGADFLIWQSELGAGVLAVPSSSAVPEPTAALLAIVACVLGVRGRRGAVQEGERYLQLTRVILK